MYLKLHPTPSGQMAALCDSGLIGKVLSDTKRQLDLAKYAPYYVGEKVSHHAAVEALRSSENANIVGEKSLAAAADAGLDVSAAVKIAGVPHLQVYRL